MGTKWVRFPKDHPIYGRRDGIPREYAPLGAAIQVPALTTKPWSLEFFRDFAWKNGRAYELMAFFQTAADSEIIGSVTPWVPVYPMSSRINETIPPFAEKLTYVGDGPYHHPTNPSEIGNGKIRPIACYIVRPFAYGPQAGGIALPIGILTMSPYISSARLLIQQGAKDLVHQTEAGFTVTYSKTPAYTWGDAKNLTLLGHFPAVLPTNIEHYYTVDITDTLDGSGDKMYYYIMPREYATNTFPGPNYNTFKESMYYYFFGFEYNDQNFWTGSPP